MTENLRTSLLRELVFLRAEWLRTEARTVEAKFVEVRARPLHRVQALLGTTDEGEEDTNRWATVQSASPQLHRPTTVCHVAARVLAERDKDPLHYSQLANELIQRAGILRSARTATRTPTGNSGPWKWSPT